MLVLMPRQKHGFEADKIYKLYYCLMVKRSEDSITVALLDELESDLRHLMKHVSDHQSGTGLDVQNIFEADQEP